MKQFKEYLTTSLFTAHKPATEHISHGFLQVSARVIVDLLYYIENKVIYFIKLSTLTSSPSTLRVGWLMLCPL